MALCDAAWRTGEMRERATLWRRVFTPCHRSPSASLQKFFPLVCLCQAHTLIRAAAHSAFIYQPLFASIVSHLYSETNISVKLGFHCSNIKQPLSNFEYLSASFK